MEHDPKKRKRSKVEVKMVETREMSRSQKVGARIRDLRLEKGLSLAVLRERGGLPQSHASSVERGRVSMTLGTLSHVAEVMDVPIFLLLTAPGEDPLSSVLEEIRQAYGGDLRRAALAIRRKVRLSDMKLRRARSRYR